MTLLIWYLVMNMDRDELLTSRIKFNCICMIHRTIGRSMIRTLIYYSSGNRIFLLFGLISNRWKSKSCIIYLTNNMFCVHQSILSDSYDRYRNFIVRFKTCFIDQRGVGMDRILMEWETNCYFILCDTFLLLKICKTL